MSTYPQFGVGGINYFWPVGDIFPLAPTWAELHAPNSVTAIASDEEAITHNLVIDWDFDYHVTLNLVDLGADIASDVDDTPATGYVRVDSRIWREWGWTGREYAWIATPEIVSSVWTGNIDMQLPPSLHPQLGNGVLWNYSINAILNDGVADYTVRTMLGTLTVRR